MAQCVVKVPVVVVMGPVLTSMAVVTLVVVVLVLV
jgi:hypothetical protein